VSKREKWGGREKALGSDAEGIIREKSWSWQRKEGDSLDTSGGGGGSAEREGGGGGKGGGRWMRTEGLKKKHGG